MHSNILTYTGDLSPFDCNSTAAKKDLVLCIQSFKLMAEEFGKSSVKLILIKSYPQSHSCKHDCFLLPWEKYSVMMALFPGGRLNEPRHMFARNSLEFNQPDHEFQKILFLCAVCIGRSAMVSAWCLWLWLPK